MKNGRPVSQVHMPQHVSLFQGIDGAIDRREIDARILFLLGTPLQLGRCEVIMLESGESGTDGPPWSRDPQALASQGV